jgi:lipopolysaccharide/colanic/teichoic acid biosynthesis glycosyltransferase
MNTKTPRSAHGIHRYAYPRGVIDRLLALVGIVVFSPLLALIALCVAIDSPGGAIFKQERIGKGGKKFTMYKFRSMRGTTDDDDYRQLLRTLVTDDKPHMVYKLSFHPRVTRVGALLRKTNLDELPQLFNVLKGDIRLVGPRPDIPYAVEFYEDWMKKRLQVKPGMTGLWQVSGGNWLSFHEMVRLDIEYVEHQSIFLDAKILWKTAGLVLRMGGNYWRRNGKVCEQSKYQVSEGSSESPCSATRA